MCLLLGGFVGLYHRAEQVLVHVVVNRNVGAFDEVVAIKLHLLAGNARACDDSVLHFRAVSQREFFHFIESFHLCSHGSVENVLRKFDVVGSVGHEVGLTLQRDDGGKVAGGLYEHASVGCLAVAALGGDGLALLADYLHCLVEVALRVGQGFLAVRQAGTGHLAEFLYISY